ncbi:MAG: DUF1343 domain-containing protein [Proteobacteria bacterium]|nr:DUF1343 domain-containing protein [Pseudomonadota bacterium]
MLRVQTGLENMLADPPAWMVDKRLGLLCNPASVNKDFVHARVLMNQKFPGRLKALFSPQHGFFAEKQDNMIESGHLTDPLLDIPIFSLYGTSRIPEKDMFNLIDILLVDLQDAGTRVYTFIYTVSYCMEVAKSMHKKVVILDRPNPVNGIQVEGNLLEPDFSSFVGRYPIPMRHGLTMGELALVFNHEFNIKCDLDVIPMKNWQRRMYFRDTNLPWIAPSPNLPTPESAMVYPGQVIWEGTNVSEGRGTTQPFEIFGAPYLNVERVLEDLGGPVLPGVVLRPLVFEPTSNKWQGTQCRGFQLHITDPDLYSPYKTTLKILRSILKNHGGEFSWKSPPYEYEYTKLPMDLILGSGDLRNQLEQQQDPDELENDWKAGLYEFSRISSKYHLYP